MVATISHEDDLSHRQWFALHFSSTLAFLNTLTQSQRGCNSSCPYLVVEFNCSRSFAKICVHLLHYHFPVLHLLHHRFPTTMCLDAAIIHVGYFCLLSRVDDTSSNATHLNSSFVFLTFPFCLAFFGSFLRRHVSLPPIFLSNCVILPPSPFSLLVLIY